jgi:hypothetical protein
MTKPHRATPEQWEFIELYADSLDADACILELRDRIEALEAAQQPPQDKLDRLIALDRDYPANSLVERIATDAELCQVYNEKTTLRAVYDLGRQHGAAPAQPGPGSSPTGSLMDRLAVALLSTTRISSADTRARTVILVMAAWLKERGYSTLLTEALAREANR